jgi:Trypsin-like peptidase domain
MFISGKVSIAYFSLIYFLSTVLINNVEVNRYAIASEVINKLSAQDSQQLPEIRVVEIMSDIGDGEKIFVGSGLLVAGKIRQTKPNPKLIDPQKTYKTYEYTVISNQHVVGNSDRNNYFVRINGEISPVYDIYTTRSNSKYDLSLLKFSSDDHWLNLPFTDFHIPQKIDGVQISANGWVENFKGNVRVTELKKIDISIVSQDTRRIYYSRDTPTKQGMSGGALISSDGELIGIHCQIDQGIPIIVVFTFYTSYKNQYDDDKQSPCFSQMIRQCKFSYVEIF